MAHIRQSRSECGLGFQVKVLDVFELLPLCSEAGVTFTNRNRVTHTAMQLFVPGV